MQFHNIVRINTSTTTIHTFESHTCNAYSMLTFEGFTSGRPETQLGPFPAGELTVWETLQEGAEEAIS